jgi:hypothetical protein
VIGVADAESCVTFQIVIERSGRAFAHCTFGVSVHLAQDVCFWVSFVLTLRILIPNVAAHMFNNDR